MNIVSNIKVVFLKNNVVTAIVPVHRLKKDDETMIAVDMGVKVAAHDVWDGNTFSSNPKLAEINALKEQKKMLANKLLSADSIAELKSAATEINGEVNP